MEEEPLMRPLFTWLLPALTWGVVLWRARSAFAGKANRSLWGSFAAIAVGVSVRPAAVETALADLTGVRDVTLLVKHLAGVAAAYFLLEYVQAVRGRPQPPGAARVRLLFAGAAAGVLTLLFFLVLPHDYDGAFGIDAHYGDPGVELYLGVFNTVFAVATAQATVLFWSNRARVPRGTVRAGVTCLAAAGATGVVYTLYRVYFVLTSGDATQLDADGTPVPLTDTICELLPAVMIILFAIGLALPLAGSFAGWVRDQYVLWRTHPLWADVTAAVPQVALGTPRGRLRDLATLGDRSVDLTHRAFALRDAALILRDGTEVVPGGAERVPHEAAPLPLDGMPVPHGPAAGRPDADGDRDEDLARVEARWLRTALRHRARNLPVPALPAILRAEAGGRSPREEVARLLAVANAYRALAPDGEPAEERLPGRDRSGV
ncbi:MAB_1171c family putative transporter [Streptomyces sp. LS1784]|uniref:MAB_1171c family putative transporter n=1 Tax=Streptomyces sp. LS1784 TaxID=2851533 RepID=UPI001CCEACFB|nr:MAB_1171c family putative transporter [Streptomyces sp. LS1784]